MSEEQIALDDALTALGFRRVYEVTDKTKEHLRNLKGVPIVVSGEHAKAVCRALSVLGFEAKQNGPD